MLDSEYVLLLGAGGGLPSKGISLGITNNYSYVFAFTDKDMEVMIGAKQYIPGDGMFYYSLKKNGDSYEMYLNRAKLNLGLESWINWDKPLITVLENWHI